MAKKRKQRRNPLAELDFGQRLELSLSDSKEPQEHRGKNRSFTDALQKRAAWFAHREQMMTEAYGNPLDSPGRRPGAWWAFEAKRERPRGKVEEWELLFDMGEIEQAEGGQVLSIWLGRLELREGYLEMYYTTYKEGGKMYHVEDAWPDQLAKYNRQAELLAVHVNGGQVAVDTWEALKQKFIDKHGHINRLSAV